MRSDAIGELLALILVVAFVLAGIVLQPDEPGSLIPCDYGFTENCE
jgi:hypothetical protein